MKELKLANSTKVTVVDDEDYDRLIQFRWAITGKNKTSVYRFFKKFYRSYGRALANEIMGVFDVTYDHKDRDGFNNQKENLRVASLSENGANRRKTKTYTSKYNGVSFNSQMNKWKSGIKKHNKDFHLGYFDTEEEAARAYDIKALEFFGEFACVNFPKEQVQTTN